MKTVKIALICLTVLMCNAVLGQEKLNLYKPLKKYVTSVASEFNVISEDRKKELIEIGNYIIEQRSQSKTCNLLFICTSNSRRSHMAQIWAQTAALYYGIDSVFTFSGGTEATKVHPNTISALRRAGFSVTTAQAGDNPTWFVSLGKNLGQWSIFSKKYNATVNPKKDFCAAMVCSEADKSCPVVEGADLRVALPYDDPKYYDNTPSQDLKYDERCRQIAREMLFVMDYVKQKMIVKSESKR